MFTYTHQYQPPAPIVPMVLVNPITNKQMSLTALIDTGADVTAIPKPIFDSLQMASAGDMLVAGYDGLPNRIPAYYVTIVIAGHTIKLQKLVAIASNEALLGRDILNHFYTEFNGPDLTFALSLEK